MANNQEPLKIRSFEERLTMHAGIGIVAGAFEHDCQEEDLVNMIGGMECKVCGCFVDNPEN